MGNGLAFALVNDNAERREQYSARGFALLRHALTRGFFKDRNQVERLKKDTDLDPLRQREDFDKLVADLDVAAKK